LKRCIEKGNCSKAAREFNIHPTTAQKIYKRWNQGQTTIPKGSTLKRVEAVPTER
jgi:hypothetical protein